MSCTLSHLSSSLCLPSVWGKAIGQGGSLAGSQWIAKGFQPRDDKRGCVRGVDKNTIYCHCVEDAGADDAAIHRVSREADILSLRLLVHSGSPRAFALAMTSMVRNGSVRFDNNPHFLITGTKQTDLSENQLRPACSFNH